MISKIFGVDVNWRQLWLDYRSEAFFAVILGALVVFSYWAASYIPESIFETFINPVQYVAIILVCLFGAFLMYRHHEDNRLRLAWMRILIIWGTMELVLLVIRLAPLYLSFSGLDARLAHMEKGQLCGASDGDPRCHRLFCSHQPDMAYHALSDSDFLSLMPSYPYVSPLVRG